MSRFPVTIFHNPACGTSRTVLQMIRDKGHEPTVVEYLATGWTEPELTDLFAQAGLTARAALRTTHELAGERGLLDEGVSDATILAAMIEHPVLVQRPLVRTPKGVVLARPAERLAEVL